MPQTKPVNDDRPANAPETGTMAPDAPEEKKKRRSLLQLGLMVGLPLLLAIGGAYFYVSGGRYVGTDDAYVEQDVVSVMPEVSGRITAVGARENEAVQQGALLFTIDDTAYRNAVAEAEAAVAMARLDVEKLKAAYLKAEAQEQTAASALAIAEAQEQRQADLVARGVASEASLNAPHLTVQNDKGALASAQQDIASAIAALAGNPDIAIDAHPEVKLALIKLAAAERDLDRTRIVAPATGIVTQANLLQKDEYVSAGTTVLSVVREKSTRIEADFKETDLTHMRVGQPVTVTVDAYPGLSFAGTVASFGAGTGSAFALIPAQNATGNWVKVVQRLPVTISLKPDTSLSLLRIGMSTTVTVDTGHSRGLPDVVTSALGALGIFVPGADRAVAAANPGSEQ